MFSRSRAKCRHILGKARSTISNPGPQKTRSDTSIAANALTNILNVGAYRLAHVCHSIDQKNLHRQKCVTGMLDELRTLGRSFNVGRGYRCAVRFGNCIGSLEIAPVDERAIHIAQVGKGAGGVAADHNPVWVKEIFDCTSLTQELRIRDHVELFSTASIQDHGTFHPCAGIDGNGALFDNNLVPIDSAGDVASHRFNMGKISLPVNGNRSSNSDEDDERFSNRLTQFSRETQVGAAMAIEE